LRSDFGDTDFADLEAMVLLGNGFMKRLYAALTKQKKGRYDQELRRLAEGFLNGLMAAPYTNQKDGIYPMIMRDFVEGRMQGLMTWDLETRTFITKISEILLAKMSPDEIPEY